METIPAVRGIIFDFGRILANFDHTKSCGRLANLCGKTAEEVQELLFAELYPQHNRGSISGVGFYREVCALLGIDHLSYADFCPMWHDIFSPNEGVEDVLSLIKPEVRRVVLSNTDPIHWMGIERLPVMERFFADPMMLVRSYDAGANKPSPRMYHEALNRLGLVAGDVVYFDDIPEYTAAFEAMGGRAVVYDCSRDPLSVLANALRAHGAI